MNGSSALGGLVLLLCACSASDPDTAAQQATAAEVVAANDQTGPASATVGAPVAKPGTPISQNGETSMEAGKQEAAAPLRASYGACIGQSGGVTPDMQDCIAMEAEYQDGRLGSAYEALHASLPSTGRQALESEQDAWLVRRTKECSWSAA